MLCEIVRRRGAIRNVWAAVKRIGPVHVDHGETDCKTPEPIAYIQRMKAHRAKMKANAV